MNYACLTVEVADRIAHIRLNRPEKANSMIPAFWRELPEAVTKISNDGEARVIVLSAAGKHFSSGMDISVFSEGLGAGGPNREVSAEAFRQTILRLQNTFSCLEQARQPVLAAVQGGAVGAGVDLATACDCRYASSDAFFAVQETAIGMTADVGSFPRLLRVIPEGWARQLVYTAERLPAERAREIGLVNQVYPTHEALIEGVLAIARTIAAHSPLAVAGCKRMSNYARDHSTADALDYIATWNAGMLRPEDILEALAARSEKRAPTFDPLKRINGQG